jgi:hypothetical protein
MLTPSDLTIWSTTHIVDIEAAPIPLNLTLSISTFTPVRYTLVSSGPHQQAFF